MEKDAIGIETLGSNIDVAFEAVVGVVQRGLDFLADRDFTVIPEAVLSVLLEIATILPVVPYEVQMRGEVHLLGGACLEVHCGIDIGSGEVRGVYPGYRRRQSGYTSGRAVNRRLNSTP
jgi:hypothetical protein